MSLPVVSELHLFFWTADILDPNISISVSWSSGNIKEMPSLNNFFLSKIWSTYPIYPLNLTMVPTDHDIPFSRTFRDFWGTFSRSFQGLFFVISNIHSRKNYQQRTFQIRHIEIIWSWVCQKNGGGRFGYVLTFLDDFLYYGYNTGSNKSAWKGGSWGPPPEFFLRIRTKSCNSRQFWRVH